MWVGCKLVALARPITASRDALRHRGGGKGAATAKQDSGQAFFLSTRAHLRAPAAAAQPFAKIWEVKEIKAALGGSARPRSEGSGPNSKSCSTTLLDRPQASSPGPDPPAQLNPSSRIPWLHSRLCVIPTRPRLRGLQRKATNSRRPLPMCAWFRAGSSSYVHSCPASRPWPTLLGAPSSGRPPSSHVLQDRRDTRIVWGPSSLVSFRDAPGGENYCKAPS